MLRVGVIGIGEMGKHHVRNYAEMNVDLVGVSDVDEKKVRKIARKYNTAGFTSYKELLKNDLDAVSVAVPTKLHKKITIDAMEMGINVLVEKPISSTLEEADEMIKAAEKENLKFMVGHIERFNPVVVELKNIIENPLYIEAHRLSPYMPRTDDVGVVLDLMIHDIDIILSLVNSKIKKINSICLKVKTERDDIANAQIIFEDNVMAVLTASRITQNKIRKLNLTQKDAYITADYVRQEILIYKYAASEYVLEKKMRYKQESIIEIPYIERGEPLKLELEHFIDCVRNDKKPEVSGRDGKRNLEVVFRILSKCL